MSIGENVAFPVDQETRAQAESFRPKRNWDLKGNDIQNAGNNGNPYGQEIIRRDSEFDITLLNSNGVNIHHCLFHILGDTGKCVVVQRNRFAVIR